MKTYDYRIIKLREQDYLPTHPAVRARWPYLVQKNEGMFFDDWKYEKSFEKMEDAEAYVKDRVWPQVIAAYKIGVEP